VLIEVAAKENLSLPPTSVASVQLFSLSGQLYTDRRSNIKVKNTEKLLFPAYNTSLFGFIY